MNSLRSALIHTKDDVSKLKKLSGMVQILKQQNRVLLEKALSAENFSRMDNLTITGLQETENEIPTDVCKNQFSKILGIK